MPKAPNDAEIVEEFTRVGLATDSCVIEVAQITWDGPHTPVTEWVTALTLPGDASPQSIADARYALLAMRRYFRICRRCKERNPLGWMDDGRVCQSCGEQYYGIVH